MDKGAVIGRRRRRGEAQILRWSRAREGVWRNGAALPASPRHRPVRIRRPKPRERERGKPKPEAKPKMAHAAGCNAHSLCDTNLCSIKPNDGTEPETERERERVACVLSKAAFGAIGATFGRRAKATLCFGSAAIGSSRGSVRAHCVSVVRVAVSVSQFSDFARPQINKERNPLIWETERIKSSGVLSSLACHFAPATVN